MTINKIDTSVFMLPTSRAAQSGVGASRSLTIVSKINEIIDEFGNLATASAIAGINAQVSAVNNGLTALSNQVSAFNTSYNNQLAALAQRIAALEISPSASITDVATTGVNVSILNLVALQALNTQATSQAQTINKILAVMRTRKEINP